MGGDCKKGLLAQLTDVQARLEAMEEEVRNLRRENELLRKENQRLKEENERMKRILNNNSSNTSLPPSTDGAGRAANRYNGRKKTEKKAGGQPGHPGKHISKAEVEEKIREGVYEHRVEEIGTSGKEYVTRYRLDIESRVIATEIRIYADENGKYQIPEHMKAEVFYGETIQGIAGHLYSEGVMANDRICDFINSLSGDTLRLSTGSVYGFCKGFAEKCEESSELIKETLLNEETICTDATTVKTNGKQTYIRNFSTETSVLYVSADKKDLKTMREMEILKKFTGTFVHDHETAMYHFGTGHGECNVHLLRYLKKNTEETDNTWSCDMSGFLHALNCARKETIETGKTEFLQEQLVQFEQRYDEIVALGREQNKHTRGKVAKKEECALLNRLEKYKVNHLLFLHDFSIPFSNNMSEKDLRICKNRQKMAGGFRTTDGRQMYCAIMSFVQTVKRRGHNILHSISSLLRGIPVLT